GRQRERLQHRPRAAKRRIAIHVLTRHWGSRRPATIPPRRARATVFAEAARSREKPAAVVASVAAALGVTAAELTDALFADLPGERLVAAPGEVLSPGELALRTN